MTLSTVYLSSFVELQKNYKIITHQTFEYLYISFFLSRSDRTTIAAIILNCLNICVGSGRRCHFA